MSYRSKSRRQSSNSSDLKEYINQKIKEKKQQRKRMEEANRKANMFKSSLHYHFFNSVKHTQKLPEIKTPTAPASFDPHANWNRQRKLWLTTVNEKNRRWFENLEIYDELDHLEEEENNFRSNPYFEYKGSILGEKETEAGLPPKSFLNKLSSIGSSSSFSESSSLLSYDSQDEEYEWPLTQEDQKKELTLIVLQPYKPNFHDGRRNCLQRFLISNYLPIMCCQFWKFWFALSSPQTIKHRQAFTRYNQRYLSAYSRRTEAIQRFSTLQCARFRRIFIQMAWISTYLKLREQRFIRVLAILAKIEIFMDSLDERRVVKTEDLKVAGDKHDQSPTTRRAKQAKDRGNISGRSSTFSDPSGGSNSSRQSPQIQVEMVDNWTTIDPLTTINNGGESELQEDPDSEKLSCFSGDTSPKAAGRKPGEPHSLAYTGVPPCPSLPSNLIKGTEAILECLSFQGIISNLKENGGFFEDGRSNRLSLDQGLLFHSCFEAQELDDLASALSGEPSTWCSKAIAELKNPLWTDCLPKRLLVKKAKVSAADFQGSSLNPSESKQTIMTSQNPNGKHFLDECLEGYLPELRAKVEKTESLLVEKKTSAIKSCMMKVALACQQNYRQILPLVVTKSKAVTAAASARSSKAFMKELNRIVDKDFKGFDLKIGDLRVQAQANLLALFRASILFYQSQEETQQEGEANIVAEFQAKGIDFAHLPEGSPAAELLKELLEKQEELLSLLTSFLSLKMKLEVSGIIRQFALLHISVFAELAEKCKMRALVFKNCLEEIAVELLKPQKPFKLTDQAALLEKIDLPEPVALKVIEKHAEYFSVLERQNAKRVAEKKESIRQVNHYRFFKRSKVLDNMQNLRFEYEQEKVLVAQALRQQSKPYTKFSAYVPLESVLDMQTQIWYDSDNSSD